MPPFIMDSFLDDSSLALAAATATQKPAGATNCLAFYTQPRNCSLTDALPAVSTTTCTITLTPIANAGVRRSFPLALGEEVIIGRTSKDEAKGLVAGFDNALYDCPVVSRKHAALIYESPDSIIIVDTDSSHGTYVNNTEVGKQRPFSLKSGDVIRLGATVSVPSGGSHDGVTFRFEETRSAPPSTSQNTFQVPSYVEDDDDSEDSQSESDRPSGIEHSSAHTTPDSKNTPDSKATLGSQHMPINLDKSDQPSRSSSSIIGIEDDDNFIRDAAAGPVAVEASDDERFALGDESDEESVYDGQIGLTSILSNADSESDSEDELEYDGGNEPLRARFYDKDDGMLSESDASDIVSVDTESDHDDEGPELMSSKPQGSPELGNDDGLFYDPVRESQQPPPLPPTNITITTGYPRPPRVSYAPTISTSGSAHATDYHLNSRWDVMPQAQPHTPFASDSSQHHPFSHSFGPSDNGSSLYSCYSAPWASPSQYFSVPTHRMESDPIFAAPAVASTDKTKISIPSIIDHQENFAIDTNAASGAEYSVPKPSSGGKKRKVDEISADSELVSVAGPSPLADATASPLTDDPTAEVNKPTADDQAWKDYMDLVLLRNAVAAAEEPPAKKIKATVKEAGKWAGAIALGSIATVTFLASPAAQSVLEWLG